MLKPPQIKKKLAWARENWTPEQWRSVIWSEESKFNVNGSHGRIRVIRKEGERFSPDHVHKTMKFVNGFIMIWGCFWAGGLGPIVTMKGSVDQDVYVDCLSNHFLPWFQKLSLEHSKEFIFQEDGAFCHTGKYATWYKQRCQTQGFDFWPPQSPDLNPIEHVWAYIERRIETRRHQLKTVDQVETCLRNEWFAIPQLFLETLVDSMIPRCRAVIEARGGNTKYNDNTGEVDDTIDTVANNATGCCIRSQLIS
ncbi:hypothetical protein [Parasitella parasitica]|uniref:Tc1-like transposase DDE domain-containing protein n=1 Tax=Parasitella parasitica TaxID=35722 RepID=A0A0B7NLQ1_9FUNG|nr:hypothetical protein [Parasitella parasitica]